MFFFNFRLQGVFDQKIQITTSSTDKYLLPPSTLSVTNNCVSVISFWCDKFPIKLGAHQEIFVNMQLYTLTEEQMIIKTKNGVIVKFS